MSVPGIGPIISSATVAAIGTGDTFTKGRDFAAFDRRASAPSGLLARFSLRLRKPDYLRLALYVRPMQSDLPLLSLEEALILLDLGGGLTNEEIIVHPRPRH